MLQGLILKAVQTYFGGTRKAWLVTSALAIAFRFVGNRFGRRELIDVSDIKPGQKVVIEHLPISHKQQMKDMKRESKQARRKNRRFFRRKTSSGAE